MTVRIKRVYDKPDADDGYRILVDRLWPRGVSKQDAKLDEWLKDIAPSPELRTWFGHKPELFDEFKARYELELDENPLVKQLTEKMRSRTSLTLLYGARDPKINHARVLLEYLQKKS